MKKIFAAFAAAATIGSAMAPAAFAQGEVDPDMQMLTQKLERALNDCDIDTAYIDTLTMSQVAGITLVASSVDPANRCQQIEAIAIDN